MSLGPGDVIGGRYELIRMLGGRASGRVYVAYDRHLARELVIRFVEPGDPAAATALLEDGRRMASAQFDSLQGIPVLDAGEIPGGGAYIASELVDGTPLELVIQRRAPLAVRDARRHALELLGACLAMRRHEPGRTDTIVASALVTSDGHIRVTRFARAPAPGPGGAEPAASHVAATLAELLSGAPVPDDLQRVIDDGRAGRIRTADELRARLLPAGGSGEPAAWSPPPPEQPPRARWPWIVVALALALLAALVVLIVVVSSDGAARPRVPDVVGQQAGPASDAILAAGLRPVRVGQASSGVPRGVVISTAPPALARVDEGATVTLTVSSGDGAVAVPRLIGLSEAKATADLAAAGLEARVLERASDAVDAGLVSAQDPAAGREIEVGASVAITISTGPEPVAVPELIDETLEDASLLLRRSGLALGTVRQEPADGTPAGRVIDQDPAPSAPVAPGTAVDVIVSAGGGTTG